MSREIASRLIVWAVLMALLAVTVAVTFAPIGPIRLVIGLGIAVIKTALIGWIFMDLRKADGLTRIAAVIALAFLTILFVMLWVSFKG
jgi:cytochrome c oxidase subunit 4